MTGIADRTSLVQLAGVSVRGFVRSSVNRPGSIRPVNMNGRERSVEADVLPVVLAPPRVEIDPIVAEYDAGTTFLAMDREKPTVEMTVSRDAPERPGDSSTVMVTEV